MDIKSITIIESIYLFYMFFIFKTNYSYNSAIFNKEIQSWGSYFIHDTKVYQNKICDFGRIMAIIAVLLAFYRIYLLQYSDLKSLVLYGSIGFDLVCIFLSYLMNFNALVYIIPLIITEIIIINKIKND